MPGSEQPFSFETGESGQEISRITRECSNIKIRIIVTVHCFAVFVCLKKGGALTPGPERI